MLKQPSISQYLISTCLFVIDELNDKYKELDKPALKEIADLKFNEMDITVRIGYPFRQMAHYTVGDKEKKGLAKSNHDIFIEQKDFKIEVKYLKNWKSSNKSKSSSNSALWSTYQADFDWLFSEIDNGYKNKRAFVIGWFNCVDYFAQMIQLGESSGSKPLANERRICYFPFLYKANHPTYTNDLLIDYSCAYDVLSVRPIGIKAGEYNCIFIGNESDTFHFALYF